MTSWTRHTRRLIVIYAILAVVALLTLVGCGAGTEKYYEVPVLPPSPTVGDIVRIGADTVLHVVCYTHRGSAQVSCVRY